jgi:hypothetical protein
MSIKELMKYMLTQKDELDMQKGSSRKMDKPTFVQRKIFLLSMSLGEYLKECTLKI